MASKKDMRRPDLVIPYVEPAKEKGEGGDFTSTFTSTLPMAAMFTRNKMLGWFALVTAILNWLSETPAQKQSAATPGYLTVGMSVMAVGVIYLPLFSPPQPNMQIATGTEAPAAAPP